MTPDPVRGDVETVPDGPEYDLDFRAHPERYRHTPDEQGVFKKYERDEDGGRVERDPQEWYDEEKYEISQVYREYLDCVRADDVYREATESHLERYGDEG